MMMKKSIYKKSICLLTAISLTFLPACMMVNSYAAETIHAKAETYVKITDLETGKVTRYQVDVAETRQEFNEKGKPVTVATFEVGDAEIIPRAGQTNYDDFDGWRGTVTITYSDDGTYACLERVVASWARRSGSATLTNQSINYGQILGTNSKKGYSTMSDTTVSRTIVTGFPSGKYGSGLEHILGATLNGKINSNQVEVVCQISF